MQKISEAYKKSMKSSLRERAYIRISFGLVNQEAQKKATVYDNGYAYYSKVNSVFKKHTDNVVYATLEENFTKVDGSMFFPPRFNEGKRYYDVGIISEKLISEVQCEVIITLNTTATNFKGFMIDFGENYPIDFNIIESTGKTIKVRGNTKSKWSTEETFENITSIKLIFYKMKNLQSRLRIHSIVFGYELVYYNDFVMSSSLDSYVSPIGADVPQFDFSVTLKNYDHYFNPDNPDSAVNYLKSGQEMDIMYGYQTPGFDTIEWIQGNHLWCSEWESDDSTITIRCQDIFRNMDSEYIRGEYSAYGKSYYKLAEEVLNDVGIFEYYIDPRLKNLYTTNPIPRVKHKEALQIIANACRCVLTQSRDGKIQIRSNVVPNVADFIMNYQDMTSFPKTIKRNVIKDIIVSYYIYQYTILGKDLIDEDVNVVEGEVETYYFQNPVYNMVVTLNGIKENTTIMGFGSYFVTIKFKVAGSFKLRIQGCQYEIIEKYVKLSLNTQGEIIRWKNPLINNIAMANELAAWLAEYYTSNVEYEYDTRGNPEIDATDVVYQENEFHDDMKVNIYRHTVNFKQAFSGRVTARRIGD